MAGKQTPTVYTLQAYKTALRAGVKKASGVFRSGGRQSNGRDSKRMSRPPAHRLDEPHRAIPWMAALQQTILRFTRRRHSTRARWQPSSNEGWAIAELDKPKFEV